MGTRQINFHEIIDNHPIGRKQYVILAFCALLMLFDGFDTQVISFIVPVLAKEWNLPKAAFGPIFSAVFFGLLIGNFGVPFLTQRIGTKKTAIIACGAFGLFTLLAAFASSVPQLITLRVLSGIGLGAATPCAVGLVSEFSPKRTRATFVMLVYIGYSLGFIFAGFACNALIPVYGWHAPLLLGSLCALAVMLILIPAVCESPVYLAQRKGPASLLRVARQFFPTFTVPAGVELVAQARQTSETHDTRVWGLFSRQLRVGTFLLWVVFATMLAAFYFLQSWLPTVLASISFPSNLVPWATGLMIFGGALGGFVTAPLMDRFNPYRLVCALYAAGGVSLFAISIAIHAPNWVLLVIAFVSGVCICGSQSMALSSLFYPAGLRAPGLAWAYGVARLGAAGGTSVAGILYANDWTADAMFRVFAIPVFIASACVALMGMRYSARQTTLAPAVASDT